MALKLMKVFKGIPANYWRIISISEDIVAKKTSVELGLYCNDKTRKASEKNILDSKLVQISGVDLTRPQIYAAIKALPIFSGATDC